MKYSMAVSSVSLIFSILAFSMAFKFYSTHAVIIVSQLDGKFVVHDIEADRAQHDFKRKTQKQ